MTAKRLVRFIHYCYNCKFKRQHAVSAAGKLCLGCLTFTLGDNRYQHIRKPTHRKQKQTA